MAGLRPSPSCVLYWGFPLLARLLLVHRIVREDGRLSIARSFRKAEWEDYLGQAGVAPEQTRIVRRFASRLCVERVAAGFRPTITNSPPSPPRLAIQPICASSCSNGHSSSAGAKQVCPARRRSAWRGRWTRTRCRWRRNQRRTSATLWRCSSGWRYWSRSHASRRAGSALRSRSTGSNGIQR